MLTRLKEGIAGAGIERRRAGGISVSPIDAMWQQRVRSVWIEEQKAEPTLPLADVDIPKNRSWRAFQLAFILFNLPALTSLRPPGPGIRPVCRRRSSVVSHWRRQDGSLPWSRGVHDWHTPTPEESWWPRWGKRPRRADALHAPPVDASAVPARGDVDLRVRANPARQEAKNGARLHSG